MKQDSLTDHRAGMRRRDFIRASTAAALVSHARAEPKMSHTTLQAGDLAAVIGDNSALGEHRAGYNGVWSLQHAKGTRSRFVPAVSCVNL